MTKAIGTWVCAGGCGYVYRVQYGSQKARREAKLQWGDKPFYCSDCDPERLNDDARLALARKLIGLRYINVSSFRYFKLVRGSMSRLITRVDVDGTMSIRPEGDTWSKRSFRVYGKHDGEDESWDGIEKFILREPTDDDVERLLKIVDELEAEVKGHWNHRYRAEQLAKIATMRADVEGRQYMLIGEWK